MNATCGTLTVLKRWIFAALGFVGMLGFGTAMGQGPGTTTTDGVGEGGIPAPKFYGDITSCAGGVLPTASTTMVLTDSLLGMGGLLDQALMGDPTAATAVIGESGNEAERTNLVMVLDPTMTGGGSANCANDVARGYTLATELYDEYTRTKTLAESRTATDADRERFAAAQAAYEAYRGAVYSEVYEQQMRSDAAGTAIDAYNALVGDEGRLAVLGSGGTGTGRGYSDITVNDFVTVTDPANPTEDETRQLNRVYGSMGIQGFQAIAGTGAVLDANGAITRTDAFNTPGVLQTGMAADTTITTLGGIATELALWETAVTTASNNLNAANRAGNLDTRALEEILRKVTAGRDHVQGELNRLTSIVRNQNREYTEASGNQFTIGTGPTAVTYAGERQVVDAYLGAQRQVTTAAGNVRSAVTALDNANKALKSALGSADSYLSQLVRLREYEQGVAETELSEAGGADAAQSFRDAVEEAKKAVTAAQELQTTHTSLTEAGTPGSDLLNALLETDATKEDDGLALVSAVSDVHDATVTNKGEIDSLKEQLTDADGNPIDLSEMGDLEGVQGDISTLDGRVTSNEEDLDDVWMDFYGTERGVEAQHDDLAACDNPGIVNVANCANARSIHNEETLEDHAMKLAQKKEYIDNLAAEIGVDPVTGEGTVDGYSRIDHNEMRSMANATAIETNAGNIMSNATNIMANQERLDAHETLVMGNVARLDAHEALVMANAAAITSNTGMIEANAGAIMAIRGMVDSNTSSINANAMNINRNAEAIETLRSGIAASMALAGMPEIGDRGVSVGAASYDGESAFAVGVHFSGENSRFKLGVTSSGGETGASVGAGWSF